jgi:hypothetical protein
MPFERELHESAIGRKIVKIEKNYLIVTNYQDDLRSNVDMDS